MNRDKCGRFIKGSGLKDITGKRYGKLVVIRLDHIKNRKSYWLCKCDCGTEKVLRSDCLTRIQSCGCVKREQDIHNLHIENHHGMANHPAFGIWAKMMGRCNNPTDNAYKDYGGRGIGVCEAWKDAREFCKWMEDNKYEKGLSIERVDVNGNYEPSNCKLIPRREQAYNKRNTVYILTDKGVVALAKEARLNGIPILTVRNRVGRGEWMYDRVFYKGRLSKNG